MSNPQHVIDIALLSSAELREKYKSTYSSWRNMKQRAREEGLVVRDEFRDFASFLAAMGPRPSINHTLDRIDPSSKIYGKKYCRWLDKEGQANNRQVTIFLTVDGVRRPLSVWAKKTEQEPDTLRARYHKGWRPREVVYGKRSEVKQSRGRFSWLPEKNAARWNERYSDYEFRKYVLPVDFFLREMRLDYDAAQDQLNELTVLVDYHVRSTVSSEYPPEYCEEYLRAHGVTVAELVANLEKLKRQQGIRLDFLRRAEAYKNDDSNRHDDLDEDADEDEDEDEEGDGKYDDDRYE